MKILTFKTLSPFFEQCRDGLKPFDIRKWDRRDKRFRAFSQVRYEDISQREWYIRFTNPANGEAFMRQILHWDYIRDKEGLCVEPIWIIIGNYPLTYSRG